MGGNTCRSRYLESRVCVEHHWGSYNSATKRAEDLNRRFSSEDTRTAEEHRKRYATSLAAREIDPGRGRLTAPGWLGSEGQTMAGAGKDAETAERSPLGCGGPAGQPPWKTVWQIPEMLTDRGTSGHGKSAPQDTPKRDEDAGPQNSGPGART